MERCSTSEGRVPASPYGRRPRLMNCRSRRKEPAAQPNQQGEQPNANHQTPGNESLLDRQQRLVLHSLEFVADVWFVRHLKKFKDR